MASDINPVGKSGNDGSWPTGDKLRPLYGQDASGNVYVMIEAGVGVGTLTNGSNATSVTGGPLAFDMATMSMTMTRYTVTTSAALALASAVAYRKGFLVYNEGPNTAYYSTDSAVTASAGSHKGIPIRPYERHLVRWGVKFAVYAIMASGATSTLQFVELV